MRDRIGYLNPYNIDICNDHNWWIDPNNPEVILPLTKEIILNYLQVHGIPLFGLKVVIEDRQQIYTPDDLAILICNRLKGYPYALFPSAWMYKTLKDEIEGLAVDNTLKSDECWADAEVEWG